MKYTKKVCEANPQLGERYWNTAQRERVQFVDKGIEDHTLFGEKRMTLANSYEVQHPR